MGVRWMLALALSLAACAPSATPIPTQAPIPVPPTATPVPPPPTSTPLALPGPNDLAGATSTPGSLLIPASVLPLFSQALRDLADSLHLRQDQIQLIRLESATWTTVDLGCGEDIQALAGGQTIDGYRLVFQAADATYEYHTDSQSRVVRCQQAGAFGSTSSSLLDTDPIAASLVALAQRRIADQLDLPARRVQLVDVTPVTWTDNSLGCPQRGQTYTQVQTDGYRIVVAAGDTEYIFHTDFDRLMLCSAGDERLPP